MEWYKAEAGFSALLTPSRGCCCIWSLRVDGAANSADQGTLASAIGGDHACHMTDT